MYRKILSALLAIQSIIRDVECNNRGNHLVDQLNLITTSNDFQSLRLRADHGLYIDKSLLIKEIVDRPKDELIFYLLRPPKFGKTVNMNMLERFFKIPDNEDEAQLNRKLFLGGDIEVNNRTKTLTKLRIAEHANITDEHLGKYPVIHLSFRNCSFKDAFDAIDWMNEKIVQFFNRRKYLAEYLKEEGITTYFPESGFSSLNIPHSYLKNLIEYMRKYYKKKVIVLIDDVDYAINQALLLYGSKSQECRRICESFGNFFSEVCEGKKHTELLILTGVTPIIKVSYHYGTYSNCKYSILSKNFSSSFGFTDQEVDQLLAQFPTSLQPRHNDMKTYCKGCIIGGRVLYSPTLILNYLKNDGAFRPNIESDQYLRILDQIPVQSTVVGELHHYISRGINKKVDVEVPISGGTSWYNIDNDERVINYLIFTGYFNAIPISDTSIYDWRATKCNSSVTNTAAKIILRRKITEWICTKLEINKTDHRNELQHHLLQLKLYDFTKSLEDILRKAKVKSLYSGAQHYYIEMLEALITQDLDYRSFYHDDGRNHVQRVDLVFAHQSTRECVLGVIVAIHAVQENHTDTLDAIAERGLQNISTMGYETELRGQNPNVQFILKLSLSFCGQLLGLKSHTKKIDTQGTSACDWIRVGSLDSTKHPENQVTTTRDAIPHTSEFPKTSSSSKDGKISSAITKGCLA